jgi:ATP-dependent protease ClpP protease subunit
MPCWSDILNEVDQHSDVIGELTRKRQEYIRNIFSITGRNVISYYSGWLKRQDAPNLSICDQDKNAFMNAVYKLDRDKGLDLILHTPGGDIAATESIVSYLNKMFNGDIRAIVPQISMSAGTMIAISCKEIIMGQQSSLGPIDPQFNGVACQAVVDEFKRAVKEVSENPASLGLWQTIISKYHPTFLTACDDGIKWSAELAEQWLKKVNPGIDIKKFKDKFLNHNNSYSHSRHISKEDCKNVGLNIVNLEDNQNLQEAVLSLHHCYMILMDKFPISKIIENNLGRIYVQNYSNID